MTETSDAPALPFHRWDVSRMLAERALIERVEMNVREAAEGVEKLAFHPLRGQVWLGVRTRLSAVEDDLTALGYARSGDARLLGAAHQVSQCLKISQRHLVGSVRKAQRVEAHKVFIAIRDYLHNLLRLIDHVLTARTGRREGPIVPELPRMERTAGRPVAVPAGWRETISGLAVPS